MTSEQAESAGPTAHAALLCAIVYILLIHPLITQHHIFCYKIRIVWNYCIYLASADMISRCVVFGCSNTPSETVSLYTSLQVTNIIDRYGPDSSAEPVQLAFKIICFHMQQAFFSTWDTPRAWC